MNSFLSTSKSEEQVSSFADITNLSAIEDEEEVFVYVVNKIFSNKKRYTFNDEKNHLDCISLELNDNDLNSIFQHLKNNFG